AKASTGAPRLEIHGQRAPSPNHPRNGWRDFHLPKAFIYSWKKNSSKKERFNFAGKGKRVVYLHPANEGPRIRGSGKKFIYILEKRNRNIFQKMFGGSEKGCMFAAAKNGNVRSGRVH